MLQGCGEAMQREGETDDGRTCPELLLQVDLQGASVDDLAILPEGFVCVLVRGEVKKSVWGNALLIFATASRPNDLTALDVQILE